MQYFLTEEGQAEYNNREGTILRQYFEEVTTVASCDWKKIKGAGEAKAMFRHCDEEKRLELNHANKQIDKSRTPLNMAFGEFEGGYENVCKAYDDFIADLDSMPGANKRKDRVTLVGWSVPVPEGMDEHTAREWTVDVYRVMVEEYGDCLLGGSAHFDEVHEYKDAETGAKRESRAHLHMYAVPVVDGKLNAKQFTARRNMVRVNNAIEAMTQANYPGFQFQTGTKQKSRKSVEELKNESAVREVVEQAEKDAAKIVAQAQNRADSMEARAAEFLDSAEADRDAAKRSLSLAKEQAREIIKKAQKDAQKASEDVQRAREELTAERESIERMKGAVSDVYQDMLREMRYFQQSRADYFKAQLHTGLQKAEEYMRKRSVRYRDGRTETVYDGYKRDVLDKQAERVARWENPDTLQQHAETARSIRRRVIDLNIAPDEKDDGGYSL